MLSVVSGDFITLSVPFTVLSKKDIVGKNVYASFWMKGLDAEDKAVFMINNGSLTNEFVYAVEESPSSIAEWTFFEGLLPVPLWDVMGPLYMNIVGTTVNPVSVCNFTMRLGKSVDTAAQFTLYTP